MDLMDHLSSPSSSVTTTGVLAILPTQDAGLRGIDNGHEVIQVEHAQGGHSEGAAVIVGLGQPALPGLLDEAPRTWRRWPVRPMMSASRITGTISPPGTETAVPIFT